MGGHLIGFPCSAMRIRFEFSVTSILRDVESVKASLLTSAITSPCRSNHAQSRLTVGLGMKRDCKPPYFCFSISPASLCQTHKPDCVDKFAASLTFAMNFLNKNFSILLQNFGSEQD